MQDCFARIASGLDVAPLIAAVKAKPHLWAQITARQDVPGTPHVDTETIYLRWAKTLTIEAVFNELPAVDFPSLHELPEAQPLIDRALELVDAVDLGRVILVNLKSGGFITPHADEGAYADHYERFHVSLESEAGNQFFVGNQDSGHYVHMRPEQLWWFNHKQTHWVVNGSQASRLHLIIDAVAPRYRRERRALSA